MTKHASKTIRIDFLGSPAAFGECSNAVPTRPHISTLGIPSLKNSRVRVTAAIPNIKKYTFSTLLVQHGDHDSWSNFHFVLQKSALPRQPPSITKRQNTTPIYTVQLTKQQNAKPIQITNTTLPYYYKLQNCKILNQYTWVA